MSQEIHPTAIIEDGAQIGNNVAIGAFCFLGANVSLGDNVILKSHVVVEGHTSIGAGTNIYSFAAIGLSPQDLKYAGEKSALTIGDNNVIREHVTIHPGTEGGGMKTVIGDNCLIMVGAHIAHDCVVGNSVIMANNATLAGHVHVGDHAILGGLSAYHQFIRIGAHAVIGGMSGVENDVIPYGRVKGERAFLAGLNLIGLERSGVDKSSIRNIQRAFKQLFDEDSTLDQRIENVANDFSDDDHVTEIINFARKKTRFPLCQPQKKKN